MQDEPTTAADQAAPVEPTSTPVNIPVVDGNAAEPAAPAAETPDTTPAAEPAPAPAEPAMRAAQPVPQSPETAVHNNGPAPVGRIIIQKTIQELESELDSGKFKSIEDFVKSHWESEDANVQRLAQVLRMDTSEVWDIIKELGAKLSHGM